MEIIRDSVLQWSANRLTSMSNRSGKTSTRISACNELWITSGFQCTRTSSCSTHLHRYVALPLYISCAWFPPSQICALETKSHTTVFMTNYITDNKFNKNPWKYLLNPPFFCFNDIEHSATAILRHLQRNEWNYFSVNAVSWSCSMCSRNTGHESGIYTDKTHAHTYSHKQGIRARYSR